MTDHQPEVRADPFRACPNGHEVSQPNAFCGVCGARAVPTTLDPQAAAGSARGSRTPRHWRWIAGAAAVALVAGTVALVLVRGAGEPPEPDAEALAVVVADSSGLCDMYTRSYIVGARVTVANSRGEILNTGTVGGGGADLNGGCAWTVELDDITRSPAYEVTVELPAGEFDDIAPDPLTLTLSYDELVQDDWRVTVGKNF